MLPDLPRDDRGDIMVEEQDEVVAVGASGSLPINPEEQISTLSNVIDTEATATQHVMPSYNNGYGDFCFVPKWSIYPAPWESGPRKHEVSIKDIQVMELDGYCR